MTMKSMTQAVGFHHRGARFLVLSASLVLVVAGMRAFKPIALPLLLAIFLSILSAPLLSWLRRHRVPKVIAVVMAVLANIAVVATFLLLIGTSANAFARAVPRYQVEIEEKADAILDWLETKGVDTSELSWLQTSEAALPSIAEATEEPASAEVTPGEFPRRGTNGEFPPPEQVPPSGLIGIGFIVNVVGSILRGIASILSTMVFVFLIMIFMLFEAGGLPRKLKLAFGWEDTYLHGISAQIQRYLGIKTLMSLLVGILVGLWVWVLDVQSPLLWGLTAFICNYIPNIGSLLAAVPPVLLAALEPGLAPAVLVAFGYLVVNTAVGNFLEPHLMGRQFGISILVVVLSLIFWGWVWGPVGMLLSVPLTMILKITLENTEDFRWLAQLMGVNPKVETLSKAVPISGPPPGG